jgi:hypothetical protein
MRRWGIALLLSVAWIALITALVILPAWVALTIEVKFLVGYAAALVLFVLMLVKSVDDEDGQP